MRSIVVTGASSGIGLACARRFLEAGDRVVAQYRTNREPLEALAAKHAGRVLAVQADLATEAGCVQVMAVAGTPDVVVHSAGIWNDGAIRTLTASVLEEMFRTNTFSAYYLSREAAKTMRKGSIIFVGSTAGERGEPGHSHYAGSKAALWGLVQSLAQELAPGIRVNLVSPGWVRTPMSEAAFAVPGRLERIVGAIPLRRVAEPEDVASAVLFLAADEQRHLTGVDLPVSGGALLPMPRG
ncbi:MAG TPA: SDR family oxidoreductase [Thermoanaerobaculaceae bacterium]|nr:SDR family oxidoreductase [Thermoanaerobaculaceae bacterium]HRS14953.1 SDR family oxidoreductase [Thermoanaerobaculaceae bacterium]